jgi:hypothetical protein
MRAIVGAYSHIRMEAKRDALESIVKRNPAKKAGSASPKRSKVA